jgi:hypothetical protein
MSNPVRRRWTPVPFTRVELGDAFWAPRVEINRTVTIPIEHEQCRETGRFDAWKLDWKPGMEPTPHYFRGLHAGRASGPGSRA